MKYVYKMPKKDVPFLRSRLGKLLRRKEDFGKIKGRVYAVGDQSVFELQKAGVALKSIFYDNKINRKSTKREIRRAIRSFVGKRIVVTNPPGFITKGLWNATKIAIRGKVKVFVRGEEDLAAVAVILLAKPGALVAYGLPDKGLILVKVSASLKKRVRKRTGIW